MTMTKEDFETIFLGRSRIEDTQSKIDTINTAIRRSLLALDNPKGTEINRTHDELKKLAELYKELNKAAAFAEVEVLAVVHAGNRILK